MTNEHKGAKILSFPGPGQAPAKVRLVPLPVEPEAYLWPELALSGETPPRAGAVEWLEQALVKCLSYSVRFVQALCALPAPCLSPELRQGPMKQLEAGQQSLFLCLELLRLGQLAEAEASALLPGLRRAWLSIVSAREQLLLGLEARERAALLVDERRLSLSSLEVEQALRLRSASRTLPAPDSALLMMVAPGGRLLEQPGAQALALKDRRQRRMNQDFLPLPPEMDLATLLEGLPQPWLEGIARSLALPGQEDRWEQEQRIRETLLNPRNQARILQNLPAISRRILVQILREEGSIRYDHLILHFGGDDEAAWHWAEEVPTTPLEQVRRSGLVYVGLGKVGRKSVRLAVIPDELHESLKRLLARLVAR